LNFIGHRLFPDKHAYTVTFYLNREEFELYRVALGVAYRWDFRQWSRDGGGSIARHANQLRFCS